MSKIEVESIDINDRIFPWKINVKDHPVVGTGSWQFKSLPELELFYGGNVILKDNVESVIYYNSHECKFIKYEISEVIPISTIRLILKEMKEK
jgi:hypothetical protein